MPTHVKPVFGLVALQARRTLSLITSSKADRVQPPHPPLPNPTQPTGKQASKHACCRALVPDRDGAAPRPPRPARHPRPQLRRAHVPRPDPPPPQRSIRMMAAAATQHVVVGKERVGEALAKMLGPKAIMVGRTDTVPAEGTGPIYIATRNDDLAAVIDKTPPNRCKDPVFMQNGMLGPFLESYGLLDNTQVLIFFAVAKKGEAPTDGVTDLNPEGLTAAHGAWANDLAATLKTTGLSCHIRRPCLKSSFGSRHLSWWGPRMAGLRWGRPCPDFIAITVSPTTVHFKYTNPTGIEGDSTSPPPSESLPAVLTLKSREKSFFPRTIKFLRSPPPLHTHTGGCGFTQPAPQDCQKSVPSSSAPTVRQTPATARADPKIDQVSSKITDLNALVTAGDVQGLRTLLDSITVEFPKYWQETRGRFWLCILTLTGIQCGNLTIVKFLCGERGVPPLAAMQDDEYGTTLPIPSSKSPISL